MMLISSTPTSRTICDFDRLASPMRLRIGSVGWSSIDGENTHAHADQVVACRHDAVVHRAARCGSAQAFCGVYVAKADTTLFNKASKVVVARKGDQTAVTMASDYQGDLKEFALVIPVPTVVSKDQIKVLESAWVDHLDAYSAPRLVEYFDPDPCLPATRKPGVWDFKAAVGGMPDMKESAPTLGVKIEAEYTVGEYDILILSATQSDGLAQWLTESGYKIPAGAAPVLGSYIKQSMKFFVARVNLAEQSKLGYQYLRPIQVKYETHKFMLPIRLGTVNANGPQDMIVLMLTENGRVETTNYRTERIPSSLDVPVFTKSEFGNFYRAMFDHQVGKDDMRVVYLEYAWDMGWCDPCAADPLPNDKLGGAWCLLGRTSRLTARRHAGDAAPDAINQRLPHASACAVRWSAFS
jgi:hypothetical protein